MQPSGWAKTEYDRERNVVFSVEGAPVGRISTNGSYQRIELGQAFAFGSRRTKDAPSVVSLGQVVREASARGDVAYVFLHGIVEEGESAQSGMADRALARARVDEVYSLWQRNGLIAEKAGQKDGRLDPEFVVVYGKEGLYRNAKEQRGNPKRIPGRVDVVLFFTDKAEKR